MHSILSGSFKLAKILPIHKDVISHLGNFRPISILRTLSKVLERLLHNRITSYHEKFDLLTPNQFGVRQKLRTTDALIELSQSIWDSWENKSKNVLFLYLKKAFDTVK